MREIWIVCLQSLAPLQRSRRCERLASMECFSMIWDGTQDIPKTSLTCHNHSCEAKVLLKSNMGSKPVKVLTPQVRRDHRRQSERGDQSQTTEPADRFSKMKLGTPLHWRFMRKRSSLPHCFTRGQVRTFLCGMQCVVFGRLERSRDGNQQT